LLGLKPERSYTYRIVAKAGATECTSHDLTFTTGSATGAPTVTRDVKDAAARARGFIVTSGGYAFTGHGAFPNAFIFDSDGATVWWADAPKDCSRALMDWEGVNMWMVATNSGAGGTGEVRRVGMDGTGMLANVDGFAKSHHDLAVAPGGVLAALVWAGDIGTAASDLVERAPDGSLSTIAHLGATLWQPNGTSFHTNSITYHPTDDTYTVGDVFVAGYVKLTRQGEPVWQLMNDCTHGTAPKCANAAVGGNHGHHLLDDDHFVYFAVNMSPPAPVREFGLSETPSSLTAKDVWSYASDSLKSAVLGDVQRLPNGNTLVVYSTDGVMQEVTADGDVVQNYTADAPPNTWPLGSFGYANFRETLYGAPIK
jgi:hypothetical protein